jgi:alcohol dehydrogenase (cytochrome c)
MGKINWTTGFRDNCRPIMAWEEGGDPTMDVVYDRVTKNIAPSLDGGKEWHPMCYSPRVNKVMVPLYNFSMDLQAKKMEWRRGEWFLGAKVITFNSGNGSIKAFDASTGDISWMRPSSAPATGGMLCTAGGLVFYGDAEGYFHAVRDDTGEELFQFNVGTGVHGNPTTYTVDGQQMVSVVVGAGGGGIWPLSYGEWLKKHTKGGGVFTFGLN